MPPSATQPTISVIIPVHNGGEAFRRCLTSLQQSDCQPHETLVVANGDETSAQLAEKFGAKAVRLPHPEGPATARNLGAKAATGDILFFVDADVEVHPPTIAQVQETFAQDPELGALMGSYDDAPGASNFLSQYKNLFHHYTHQTGAEEASTFWGACGAMRRDLFLDLGGFDEGYRKPCVEDIELGYRLKNAGYRIALCKDIQVKHLKRWEMISLLKAEFFYRALPWTDLLLRKQQINNDLNLKWSSRLSVVCVYVLLLCMAIALWQPWSLAIALCCAIALLVLNASVYQFFWQKRGFFFMLRVIPWHWLYFFYGGLAFAIGTVRYRLLPSSAIMGQ
ncbi:MAG: glycosyltransferase [Jaaginema sp. PMC 1080.18]|nr:glycosyltransferase [Jaaginema sp. PMC 1080.18]